MSEPRFEHGTSQIQKRTWPWLWLILYLKHSHVSYTTSHSKVVVTCSGVAMGEKGGVVILILPRWATQCKGPQNEYFKFKKKLHFLHSTNFKLLCQINKNSINCCDFFKLTISLSGGHFDHSPRAPRHLPTPLATRGKVVRLTCKSYQFLCSFCTKNPLKQVLFRKLFLLKKSQLFFPLAFGFSSGRIMNTWACMMGGILIYHSCDIRYCSLGCTSDKHTTLLKYKLLINWADTVQIA
jgi:hypothetical protein